MFNPDLIDNPIRTAVDNNGNVWHYFAGSFWSTVLFEGKKRLLAAPARLDGGIEIDMGEVNACDVEECEQVHLDFVNSVFGTNFVLIGATEDNPIGRPSYG